MCFCWFLAIGSMEVLSHADTMRRSSSTVNLTTHVGFLAMDPNWVSDGNYSVHTSPCGDSNCGDSKIKSILMLDPSSRRFVKNTFSLVSESISCQIINNSKLIRKAIR